MLKRTRWSLEVIQFRIIVKELYALFLIRGEPETGTRSTVAPVHSLAVENGPVLHRRFYWELNLRRKAKGSHFIISVRDMVVVMIFI